MQYYRVLNRKECAYLTLSPTVCKLYITIAICPCYFIIAKFHNLKMIMFFFHRVFNVMHQWRDGNDANIIETHIVIFYFLSGVINAIPPELSRFKGLASRYGFHQVRGGRIDFFLKHDWGMVTFTGNFPGQWIGWEAKIVCKAGDFNASLTVTNIHRACNFCATIVS